MGIRPFLDLRNYKGVTAPFNFSGSAAGREENDFHEFDDRTEKSGRRTKASTRREAYRNDQNFGAVR